jgi:acetolactate synthase-1/2/3 large subunit
MGSTAVYAQHPEETDITTAARAIALELCALGVENFFLVTGRDNTLWIALQEAGIRQVLARSESGAVYMADGYARMTGRPTFVYGGYGPGAANVAGSLAEPFWSSSPVIAMPSAMRREDRFKKEYQELDQLQLFASVTKWSVEASTANQVPRFLREAARRALSGTPGPVYVGIPGDIYEEELTNYQEPMAGEQPFDQPLARPAPTQAETEAVLAALMSASRPVILAGNGIHQSAAYEPLRLVAERLEIPVVTSMAGKGSIPETHELALGAVGRYSRNYANAALRDADVILAIGTQLGGMVTDSYRLISPDASLIHVTVDPEVIGLNFKTCQGLVADACSFLTVLLAACDRSDEWPTRDMGYLGKLSQTRREWREQRSALASRDGSDGSPMRPEAVMAALDDGIADDAVVVADTGYASAWPGALLDVKVAGRRFLRADGSLGWAFPGALGAQMAVPDRQVVCVIGDGGFGYHIGELETAIRLGLPVVTVILNNQTLAFEAHVQTLLYGHKVPEVDDFCDVDYAQIARAFGVRGIRTTNASEFRQALAIGLERQGPTVIDALIDREAIAPVTRYDRVRVREL